MFRFKCDYPVELIVTATICLEFVRMTVYYIVIFIENWLEMMIFYIFSLFFFVLFAFYIIIALFCKSLDFLKARF